jgi:hypothetical protein
MGNDLGAQKLYADHIRSIKLKRERAGLTNTEINFLDKNVEIIDSYKAEQKRKQQKREILDLKI